MGFIYRRFLGCCAGSLGKNYDDKSDRLDLYSEWAIAYLQGLVQGMAKLSFSGWNN